MIMNLKDDIRPLLDRGRDAIARGRRFRTGSPAAERSSDVQTRTADTWITLPIGIAFARFSAAIQEQNRVVHDFRVPRSKFHHLDVLTLVGIQWNGEALENVRAFRRHRVGLL